MTNLTQAQTKAMKTLKSFFNPKYASETLCHVSDVAISEITRTRLADEGFITIELGFISFTAKGKEVMGLTVAEVVSEVFEPTVAEPEPQKLSSFNEGDTVSLNIRDNIWQSVVVASKWIDEDGVMVKVSVADKPSDTMTYGGDYFKAIGLSVAKPQMTTEQAAVLEEVAILYYNEKSTEPIIQTREAHNAGWSQVKISRELAEGLRDLGYLGSHFHSFWLTAKGCQWAGDYWKAYRMSKLV